MKLKFIAMLNSILHNAYNVAKDSYRICQCIILDFVLNSLQFCYIVFYVAKLATQLQGSLAFLIKS